MSRSNKGVGKVGVGTKTPWAWYFTKAIICAKADWLFSHTFCLFICRLNANITEWICMQISRNIVNGPKSNNYRFCWESGLSSTSRNHLTTFCRPFVHYACLKIAFRDNSLYPKQFSLFCLLWLISASADRIGYITNFCSMIKLLHELSKTAVVNIEVFRHLIMSQQAERKTKSFLDFYT